MTRRKEMQRAYMPLYTGRYLSKTRRLNVAQNGAYLMLLMALWDEGGSLPHDEDELREIVRATRRQWPKIWASIARYFILTEGEVRHHMIDEVLADFEAVRAAKVRGGKRSQAIQREKRKQNKGGASGELKQSLSNQANGLDSSLQEESPSRVVTPDEKKRFTKTFAEALGQEPGASGGLAREDREQFSQILTSGLLREKVSDRSLRQVAAALIGREGDVFIVSEACASPADWLRIQKEFLHFKCHLKLSEQRQLRLVSGGES